MPSLTVKHNTLTLEDITTDDAGHTRNSSNTSTKSQTSVGYSSQSSQQAHSRQSSEDSSHNRNPSAGSSDTGIFGSMEKNKGRRVDRGGRVDPEEVINELMEDIQLDNMAVQEGKAVKTILTFTYLTLSCLDSGGLQLYLGPDGSVRFDQPSTLDTDYQPVVIDQQPLSQSQ